MGTIERAFRQTTQKIPELVLTKLVREKLVTAGLKKPGRLPSKIAKHILEGRTEEISINDADDIHISFDETDFEELERGVDKIIDKMPDVVYKLVKSSARLMADSLFEKYDAYLRYQERRTSTFLNNLEDRWGLALDGLRLLLQMNIEFGQEFLSRAERSKAKKNRHKRAVLCRLHVRACQVMNEIIVLLENGFADGAMARWRTLHEIAVVAYVLDEAGDDVAEKYIAHEAVEAKKALDTYLSVYKDLQFDPPTNRDMRAVNRNYSAVLAKHGPEFKNDFGWAAAHLCNKSPRFSDLERRAGRAQMRSHYKLASQKVHASPKGLTDPLCLLDPNSQPIAGATNAGLEEPGQNCAIYATLWIPLIIAKRGGLDRAVELSTAVEVRDRTIDRFMQAANELRSEHESVKRTLKREFPNENPEIIWA